jgi:hypothetical protein
MGVYCEPCKKNGNWVILSTMSELTYENPFVHITELALSVLGIHKFIMGGRFGQI